MTQSSKEIMDISTPNKLMSWLYDLSKEHTSKCNCSRCEQVNKTLHYLDTAYKKIKQTEDKILALEAENAELRAALVNIRDDIGKTAPEVIWRGEKPETTFDYITHIIGGELTYDKWAAKEQS